MRAGEPRRACRARAPPHRAPTRDARTGGWLTGGGGCRARLQLGPRSESGKTRLGLGTGSESGKTKLRRQDEWWWCRAPPQRAPTRGARTGVLASVRVVNCGQALFTLTPTLSRQGRGGRWVPDRGPVRRNSAGMTTLRRRDDVAETRPRTFWLKSGLVAR